MDRAVAFAIDACQKSKELTQSTRRRRDHSIITTWPSGSRSARTGQDEVIDRTTVSWPSALPRIPEPAPLLCVFCVNRVFRIDVRQDAQRDVSVTLID
jgi:hypothetical protein